MEGEIYTEVDASVLNPGISTMAMVSGSPEPPEGEGLVVVWYRWRYDEEDGSGGFTGKDWYFDDPNNPLNDHFTTEQDFKDYLVSDRPQNLDAYLGNWSAESKQLFLASHTMELFPLGCIYYAS